MSSSVDATFISVEEEVEKEEERREVFSFAETSEDWYLIKIPNMFHFFSIYTGSFWTPAFKANFTRRKLVTLSSGNVIAA